MSEALEKKLQAIYNHFNTSRSRKEHQKRQQIFVFNMTDWIENFQQLAQLYAAPDQFSDEEASGIVAGFLNHAPHHLIAASRLLLQHVPQDIFYELEENPVQEKT
jgi:hypothetical protein